MNVETDKCFPSESATTYIFGSAKSTLGRKPIDSTVSPSCCSVRVMQYHPDTAQRKMCLNLFHLICGHCGVAGDLADSSRQG